MEHAFELPRALPDRSPLDRAMAGLDAEGILRGCLRALGMDNLGAAGAGRRA